MLYCFFGNKHSFQIIRLDIQLVLYSHLIKCTYLGICTFCYCCYYPRLLLNCTHQEPYPIIVNTLYCQTLLLSIQILLLPSQPYRYQTLDIANDGHLPFCYYCQHPILPVTCIVNTLYCQYRFCYHHQYPTLSITIQYQK